MLSHPHYPLPRTKLASLVKGEVLSPDKIRATTGGIATPPTMPRTNPSKTALSPLAFRTAIVCVCLYGFTFELSHLLFDCIRLCVLIRFCF